MKLGMIIPTYPNERRVALLPEHIKDFENELMIERGFGATMDIPDAAYEQAGCTLASREEIFQTCEAIFSLKLIQPEDYDYIRKGQIIIGWTHPEETGKPFMEAVGYEKELIIVDLDNITPAVHLKDRKTEIPWIPSNFVHRNSFAAGYAATLHALMSYGALPDHETRIAVLGSGNVSQGAYAAAVKLGAHQIRLFYRKTMDQFFESIAEYDVIISGIEIDKRDTHLISMEDQRHLKTGAVVIDAAADAGYTIEGTRYTSIDEPFYVEDGIYYYCVNNAPSVLYREASQEISKAFSEWVYRYDVSKYSDLAQQLK